MELNDSQSVNVPLQSADPNATCDIETKTRWYSSRRRICYLLITVVVLTVLGLGVVLGVFICKQDQSKPPPNTNMTNEHLSGSYLSGSVACILHTSEDIMKILRKNPFGDRCTLGSRFVNDTCGKSGVLCQRCINGMLLPRYCFCDLVENCNRDVGAVKDAVRKFDCHECVSIFRETFIGRASGEDIGTCNNAGDRTPVDSPQCKDGFGGFMCFTITKRVCKPMNGQPGGRLRSCEEEEEGYREKKCTIVRNQETYLCRSFDDSYHQNNNIRDCGVS